MAYGVEQAETEAVAGVNARRSLPRVLKKFLELIVHRTAVLTVRIHLPPAVNQVRTAIGPPEFPLAPRKQKLLGHGGYSQARRSPSPSHGEFQQLARLWCK